MKQVVKVDRNSKEDEREIQMKKCISCGFKNPDESKFCKKCGKKLEEQKNMKTCRFCGMKVSEEVLFCINCGKSMNQKTEVQKSDSQKKGKWFILLLIVVLIAIIMVIGAFFLKSRIEEQSDDTHNKKTEQSTNKKQETEKELQNVENEEDEDSVSKAELTTLECQKLCMDMMNLESVYGSSYEKAAVSMAEAMVNATIISKDTSYRMQDISEENQERFIWNLLNNLANSTPLSWELKEKGLLMKFSLTDYKEDLKNSSYDISSVSAVYKKTDLKRLMEAFCAYTTVEWLYDFDEYVGFQMADGEPWEYFDAYDIKEQGDYVLIHGNCYMGSNGGDENVYQYTFNALFEKTEETIFGLRAVYVEGYENEIKRNIASITASSQLANYKNKTYGPKNLIDGDKQTPWVEGVSGVGVGETVLIKLNQKAWVQEFVVYNGYQESEELFDKNGYVNKISIDFGNGIVEELECSGEYDYSDSGYFNKISLDRPVYTDTITIKILSASAGYKYQDTCISEIGLY